MFYPLEHGNWEEWVELGKVWWPWRVSIGDVDKTSNNCSVKTRKQWKMKDEEHRESKSNKQIQC